MIQEHGVWWPDDVGLKWQHALRHVQALEYAIAACSEHRTAVQAGGNIGLWPKRLAEVFQRVLTFEPEPISRACLEQNVPDHVIISGCALGDSPGRCSISRKSLGSHRVVDGVEIEVITVDSLELDDLDLLQLDIEGYEWHALMGALETISNCQPVIHLELRGFTAKYGHSDDDVRKLLASMGYRLVSQQPGNDFVFLWGG